MGVDGERWRGEGGEVLRAGSRLERVMTADGGDRSGQRGQQHEEAAGRGQGTGDVLDMPDSHQRHTALLGILLKT